MPDVPGDLLPLERPTPLIRSQALQSRWVNFSVRNAEALSHFSGGRPPGLRFSSASRSPWSLRSANGRPGGSACRWPQVFDTLAIRLRPMTLFNPVFNCLTPIVIKRSKTQADEGLTPADEAGSVVLRQPPASKLANLFRIDVRDQALGLVSQQLGGRVTEHRPAGWLGPRTPSLREGPGSASVPSGSPDPAAGTGCEFWGTSHRSRGKTGLTTQENECEKGKLRLRENRRSWFLHRHLGFEIDNLGNSA